MKDRQSLADDYLHNVQFKSVSRRHTTRYMKITYHFTISQICMYEQINHIIKIKSTHRII